MRPKFPDNLVAEYLLILCDHIPAWRLLSGCWANILHAHPRDSGRELPSIVWNLRAGEITEHIVSTYINSVVIVFFNNLRRYSTRSVSA